MYRLYLPKTNVRRLQVRRIKDKHVVLRLTTLRWVMDINELNVNTQETTNTRVLVQLARTQRHDRLVHRMIRILYRCCYRMR